MAITEALAAGRPAVVTEECNFDELEESGCGTIIKSGDMTAFVQACAGLLNNEPARAAMGARGRDLVERNYTWEGIAATIENAYRDILAASRGK